MATLGLELPFNFRQPASEPIRAYDGVQHVSVRSYVLAKIRLYRVQRLYQARLAILVRAVAIKGRVSINEVYSSNNIRIRGPDQLCQSLNAPFARSRRVMCNEDMVERVCPEVRIQIMKTPGSRAGSHRPTTLRKPWH